MKAIGVVVVFVLGTAIYLAFFGHSVPEGDDPVMACVKAERFVREKLKAAATAKFQSCVDIHAVRTRDNWWSVSGYVDSENGFGATVRTTWVAELKYDSTWHARYVGFADQSTD